MSGVILLKDIPAPYPIFGLVSITLWQLFANTLTLTTDSLLGAGGLLSKVKFPRIAVVLTAVGQSLVHFVTTTFLVVIAYILYFRVPPWTVILAPLYLVPILLVGLGLGLIFTVLNVVIRDIKPMISLGVNFLLYLMPIMYIQPRDSLLGRVNMFNPLYYLIFTARELVLVGSITYPYQYLVAILISAVIFIGGLTFFYRTHQYVLERI